MFDSLLQTNIRVRNLAKAVDWYQEVLGLRLINVYEDTTALLDFGIREADTQNPIICLIKLSENEEQITADTITYPVFKIADAKIGTIYDELKRKGVRVEETPANKAHFKFYDCEGNLIECFHPKAYE
ncbi:VOC family protein [Alkalihalobacillus sp. AL-G]|uniref:VOC family protein n=1 Tax=Alkalihalobacillus sp. AL-G TaxID=2926399 RepID=UPI00272A610C|nr:VOC family protein [Alkalihalobacillus sp. AL-G]WLD94316.1 VOC family protein [Alkalihalobacillus sp. AL-G]